MSRRTRSIGTIPEGVPEDVARWMHQVNQQMRAVQQIAGVGSGTGSAAGGGMTGPPGPAGPPGDPGGTYTPDPTPPPTPSGVTVSAGISFVAIQTDAPVFSEGHGYLRTIVYGVKWPSGSAPTFASAVQVHEFTGDFSAFVTDPSTRWCIWLKWESVDGELSTTPSGGTNGHQVTTGQDVSALLTALAGEITASELHTSLGARINLIDTPTTGLVDRATALETITSAALSGNAALASRSTALEAAVDDIEGDVAATASALDAVELIVGHGTSGNAALATRTTSLEATVNNGTTGVAATAAALDVVELIVTNGTSGNAALASSVSTLVARVDYGNAAPFSPQIAWQFDASLDGWSGYAGSFGSVTSSSTALLGVANGSGNLIIQRNLVTAEQFLGARADKVRMRLRRTSGTGGWSGVMYFGNPGHGDNVSFYKQIVEPAWGVDGWAIAEWDMTSLTAGGTDWVANTVQRLRFDLTAGASSGAAFEIDWIAAGTRAHGVSTVALQQEATTRATETGALFAQWTVKLDVNGYVSGFGLASTGGTATPTSSFIVRADSFAVASPSGPGITPAVPFIVRTTPGTVNGVAYPAGVYMDSAFILDLTAAVARMGNLWVTNAMVANLSVSKLVAGSMTAGAYVRSTTYVAGASGFTIEANGFAEFNNVVVRGTVYASAGTFAGSLSAATGTFAGALSAATGTFAGALSAATGTFAGSLSAATGTFAGSLTAATGSFFSSTSGQRITINESGSNEARFYGNRGDGNITQLASIGINTVGGDSVVIAVGDTASGNSRVGMVAQSNSARAIQGSSVSSQGLFGVSTSAEGVWGQSTSQAGVLGVSSGTGVATAGVAGTNGSSGPGVHGISASGNGVQAYGNGTRAPLKLVPNAGWPSNREGGQITFQSRTITDEFGGTISVSCPAYTSGDGVWRWVSDNTIAA